MPLTFLCVGMEALPSRPNGTGQANWETVRVLGLGLKTYEIIEACMQRGGLPNLEI